MAPNKAANALKEALTCRFPLKSPITTKFTALPTFRWFLFFSLRGNEPKRLSNKEMKKKKWRAAQWLPFVVVFFAFVLRIVQIPSLSKPETKADS